MRQWLISKIPTWALRYLGWRNVRMALSGHPRKTLFSYWADMELDWRELQISLGCKPVPRKPPFILGPEKPTGVPEWLAKEPESCGYGDGPEDQITTSVRGPLGLTSEQRRHLIRWRDRR